MKETSNIYFSDIEEGCIKCGGEWHEIAITNEDPDRVISTWQCKACGKKIEVLFVFKSWHEENLYYG